MNHFLPLTDDMNFLMTATHERSASHVFTSQLPNQATPAAAAATAAQTQHDKDQCDGTPATGRQLAAAVMSYLLDNGLMQVATMLDHMLSR